MSKQDANRFDREDRRGAARRTYPTQGGPRVGRVQTNVPRAERYDADFGAKKPYGGKKDFGDRPYSNKRDFDERKPYGEPSDDFGTKKPYGGKKSFDERPHGRDFEDRPYNNKRDFDDHPHAPKRDFGDRPYGGDRYYDGDPKRRREERGPRPALPPRAEPMPAEPELSVEETAEMEHMLCGRNPIREALRAGRTVEKLLAANGDLSGSAREIIQMAREAGAVHALVGVSPQETAVAPNLTARENLELMVGAYGLADAQAARYGRIHFYYNRLRRFHNVKHVGCDGAEAEIAVLIHGRDLHPGHIHGIQGFMYEIRQL